MNLITKIAPILFVNIFFTQNVISQSSFTNQWQYDIFISNLAHANLSSIKVKQKILNQKLLQFLCKQFFLLQYLNL